MMTEAAWIALKLLVGAIGLLLVLAAVVWVTIVACVLWVVVQVFDETAEM